jgi:hypothetical protein
VLLLARVLPVEPATALTPNAFAVAATYYERALELWPGDDRERPRVLFTGRGAASKRS